MSKKLLWGGCAAFLLLFAIIQFIPSPPVLVPAQLPAEQRMAHRLLQFEGIANFRDLGGYRSEDGRSVRWGRLYRSGHHALATPTDLATVAGLGLANVIDFRSGFEKEEEPDRRPDNAGYEVLEIPILDEGNQALARDLAARIETGDLADFDPDQLMIQANRDFASRFSPQYSEFMQAVLATAGEPMLWHCTAGKDRAGFASALVLRTLGVPETVIIEDYLLSRDPAIAARSRELFLIRLFKGEAAAHKVRTLLGAEQHWLQAAFEQIRQDWDDFDTYRRQALGISDADVTRLKNTLLE